MPIQDFFNENFVRPIVEQGVAGYNIINTTVYAVIFALAVFGVYKLLVKLKIKINREFFIGIFPFILFGSLLRVVRDSNIYPSPLLVSPIIYMVIFVIALISLLVSLGAAKLIWKQNYLQDYYKIWAIIGAILVAADIILLSPLEIKNWTALGIVLGIAAVWAAVIYAAYRFRAKAKFLGWLSKENAGLLFTHMFDASTTFTALQFYSSEGYYEQHVLSNAVIDIFGPAGQFLLKLAIVPLVLWILDRELAKPEDKQLRGFLKIAIFIIGFAPGLRNLTRLVIGV